MKEITLKVPDQKINFVLEFAEQLGLEVAGQELEIPESHKTIVRDRIKKSQAQPKRLLDWEKVKDQFKHV